MTLNHVHLRVRDLAAAVDWCTAVLQVHPEFQSDRIAAFTFDAFTIIFDAAPEDVEATVGFTSDDCDRDFRAVVERGATPIEPPADRDWGIRVAYFLGPGRLKFEIEGPISDRRA